MFFFTKFGASTAILKLIETYSSDNSIKREQAILVELSDYDRIAAVAKLLSAQIDGAAVQQDENGAKPKLKYILDSAAHPSHINYPPDHLSSTPSSMTTLTAGPYTMHPTSKGILQPRNENGYKFVLSALYHPCMLANLISVHEMTTSG